MDDKADRTITCRVASYGETTTLLGPAGQRLAPGCFAASVARRPAVPLIHGRQYQDAAIGTAIEWEDRPTGLIGTFRIRRDAEGELALRFAVDGFLSALEPRFRITKRRRGIDGAEEVIEARLTAVSFVGVGAYDSTRVLRTRCSYARTKALMGPLARPAPQVDLSPVPA